MLRDFLQASVLSSEGDNDNEEQSKEVILVLPPLRTSPN